VPGALFEPDGDDVVATTLTSGPWDPGAQFGGAPAALLAWAVERVPTLVPMRLARLTVDLHRPVPVGRLRVATEIAREGKRLQIVTATIRSGDVEVARATALRLRLGEGPTVTTDPDRPPVVPPGRPVEESHAVDGRGPGFMASLEVRRADDGSAGPWFRMVAPVVAGEVASPTVCLAMVADFAANSANYLDPTRWSAINPDLTVHLARPPAGEWFTVSARSWHGRDGIGHSRADVFDLDGFLGTVTTASLVDEVPAPYAT
jgi:hypothetical protein